MGGSLVAMVESRAPEAGGWAVCNSQCRYGSTGHCHMCPVLLEAHTQVLSNVILIQFRREKPLCPASHMDTEPKVPLLSACRESCTVSLALCLCILGLHQEVLHPRCERPWHG